MMSAQRRHRCGGTLVASAVQVLFDLADGISLGYRVHGFVCDTCHEQLIDRETAFEIQASQTPTIAWQPRRAASTWLDVMRFAPLTASTPHEAIV